MFRRRTSRSEESPDSVYLGLRAQALSITAEALAPASSEWPHVLGAVVDITRESGMASVVALADGTTSMYTSTGGGVIGAGTRAEVAEKGRAFLDTLQRRLDLFPPDERDDLPQSTFVQITIITGSGRRRACIPTPAFWGQEPSTVVDIIGAAQDLVSAIRRTQTRP